MYKRQVVAKLLFLPERFINRITAPAITATSTTTQIIIINDFFELLTACLPLDVYKRQAVINRNVMLKQKKTSQQSTKSFLLSLIHILFRVFTSAIDKFCNTVCYVEIARKLLLYIKSCFLSIFTAALIDLSLIHIYASLAKRG